MRQFVIALCFMSFVVNATSLSVTLQATGGNKRLGMVEFVDSPHGLLIKPNLSSLPPGLHGFHLHQKATCANDGMGAGGHFDPKHTNSHLGPYAEGHLGDLPVLYVDKSGNANTPVLAPRLKTMQLFGRALMIHAGGDNYSNSPPLGGGGARIACGVIEKIKPRVLPKPKRLPVSKPKGLIEETFGTFGVPD